MRIAALWAALVLVGCDRASPSAPVEPKAINLTAKIPNVGWQYKTEVDNMRQTSLPEATILSENSEALTFSGDAQRAMILIYKGADGEDGVSLIFRGGQLSCQKECVIDVKPDNKSIQGWYATPNSEVIDSLALDHPWCAVKALSNASKLIVELPFYGIGKRQFMFNVIGLKWQPSKMYVCLPNV